MLLRCGACDTWREVTVTNEVAARFDLELDRRLDIVARALEKLDHKRMIAEAETMIQMLRHGLVDAADRSLTRFNRRRCWESPPPPP